MKKHTIMAVFILLVAVIACSKSAPQPSLEPAAIDKVITFNKHIKPLFADRCAPCHLTGGDRINKYDDYNTVNTHGFTEIVES